MHPDAKYIFLPLLAHMLLVFALFIKLGIEKTKAIRAGQVNRAAAALDNTVWPEGVRKVSNNIDNQFQVPMMFYALSFIAYLSGSSGPVTLAMLGLFAASRYAHAYIHITSNYVPHRFRTFVFGTLVLLALSIMQLLALIQVL